ncbi:unnamed protein product [Notodromas monacha]|uniref:Sodium-dependent glucose transporter 1 n=1 Tax=Notodromas monacha TaxID=399045 RepID=A0A7R9BM17_9CRUS|nr:unnamed protein product [Notodromas monacha]CAG0917701.1 unnamed protein product [Notodromas monacha]
MMSNAGSASRDKVAQQEEEEAEGGGGDENLMEESTMAMLPSEKPTVTFRMSEDQQMSVEDQQSTVTSSATRWERFKFGYYTAILYLSFIGLDAEVGGKVAIIFDHGHRLEIYGAVNILGGISICVAPLMFNFWGFCFVIFLSGLFTGVMDAGGNVMLLSLWEGGSAPYMQALHFFFGLGAFLTPLISEPFLSPDVNREQLLHNETVSFLLDNGTVSKVDAHVDRDEVAAMIRIPYLMVMVWMVLVGLCFWHLALVHRCSGVMSPFERRTSGSAAAAAAAAEDDGEGEGGQQKTRQAPKVARALRWFTIFAMSMFFFFYVGMEVAYGQLVFTFAVTSGASLKKPEAAFLNSAYWGTYTATRLISIFVAVCVPPMVMMWVDFGVVTLAAAILLAGAETPAGLWVGSALLGIGMASIFPTGIMWYESHVMVSSKIASVFLIGSAAGEMTVPYLSSVLMPLNPMYLVYLVCTVDACCIIVFVMVTVALTRRRN